MKNKLMFLFLFLASASFGQIKETMKEMSLGIQNALSLEVRPATEKITKNTWEDFAKKYSKNTKRIKKFDEWFTDNANIPAINETGTCDLYMNIVPQSNGVVLNLFVDAGGSFVSLEKSPKQFEGASALLREYSIVLRKAVITEEMNKEKDKLGDFESDKKKLIRTNEKLHKEIEDAKKLIAENEKKIEQNLKDQDKNKKDIENQKNTVEGLMKRLSEVN